MKWKMVKIMAKVADYEKYMQELENILEKLQTEEISLDETLTMYAKVAVLIDKCNTILKTAKLEIEEISAKIDI